MTTAASNTEAATSADPRVPFPPITRQTACRTEPERWFPEQYSRDSIEKRQAQSECRRCPIAEQCLLWALANPELAEHGIWAATTPKKRTPLRGDMVERLGPDWVAVVVAQRQAREARRWQGRIRPAAPLAAHAPATPTAAPVVAGVPRNWEPVTPEQAARNRATLLAALRERRAA